MATEDRNGDLHSEKNGRFVSKGESDAAKREEAERIYGDNSPQLPAKIKLPDEYIPRSVGAMWRNLEIDMPDGTKAKLVEGSKLQNKEIFAGKGTRNIIRDRYRLAETYEGTKPNEWKKVKALAEIVTEKGEQFKAEIHWYEEDSYGKVEGKYKKWVE